MDDAHRTALLAFLHARLDEEPPGPAAWALRAVAALAEAAFADDEEWSLVPDPVARTVPFVRAEFAQAALVRAVDAWRGRPEHPGGR